MKLFGRVALATGSDYPSSDRLLSSAQTLEILSQHEVLSTEEVDRLTNFIHDLLEPHYEEIKDLD